MGKYWTKKKYGKIELTDLAINFIKDNFDKMTNKELADHLGLNLTRLRNEVYKMSLQRIEMEYWTDEQVQYLKDNYKKNGDVELAEYYEKTWPKNKPWSGKHIEKKRRYLNLKRSMSDIKNIKIRNIEKGRFKICPVKAWDTIGRMPVGTIRYWKTLASERVPFIKTETGFVHYARWRYTQIHGPLSPGMNVVFKDGDYKNIRDSNFIALTDAELPYHNKHRLYSMPEELQTAIKTTIKLNKIIKEKLNGNKK